MRIPARFGFICFFFSLLLSGCPNVREESQLSLTRCDGTASPFASGSGSASDPYLICSASQLQNVTNQLSSSYKLGKSISLQGVSFSPIGTNDTAGFSGTFDGAGYTISNWSYSNPTDPYAIGFVRKLATGGVIKNLTLSTVVLSGNDVVAGVAGFSQGTISAVTLRNALLNSKSTVAGIVGEATGSATISKAVVSSATLNSTANGNRMNLTPALPNDLNGAAGVAAIWKSTGTIDQATVTSATIDFDKDSGFNEALYTFTGGIVAYLATGSITNSSFSGALEGYFDVGGVAGYSDAAISDSVASGTVKGNSRVGGVVGIASGSSSTARTSFQGVVLGDDITLGVGGGIFAGNVGGVVGSLSGTLSESFFSGAVDADKRVGGVVGLASGATINDCYAHGTVNGNIDPVAGAFGTLDLGSTTRVYVYMTSIGGGTGPSAAIPQEFEGPGSSAVAITNVYYFDNATVANGSLGSSFSSLSLFQDISNYTGFVASGNWTTPTIYPGRSVLSPILSWECGKNGISCTP